MARVEVIAIGLLTMTGEFRDGGGHVDVSIRGQGIAGQRPLCGRIVVSADEWKSLLEAAPGAGWTKPPEVACGG